MRRAPAASAVQHQEFVWTGGVGESPGAQRRCGPPPGPPTAPFPGLCGLVATRHGPPPEPAVPPPVLGTGPALAVVLWPRHPTEPTLSHATSAKGLPWATPRDLWTSHECCGWPCSRTAAWRRRSGWCGRFGSPSGWPRPSPYARGSAPPRHRKRGAGNGARCSAWRALSGSGDTWFTGRRAGLV